MATSKDYLQFVSEQLSALEEISYRPMMGEYIVYYKGKIAAYLCDNRFFGENFAEYVENASQRTV